MRSVQRNWFLALLAVALLALPLRAAEKKDIDKAIENGVAYLKSIQEADGTWQFNQEIAGASTRQIGATALAALTLLECDVPADDPVIQKAAKAIRTASIGVDTTYSLSLCILFLDRLGDTDDVPLIEGMTVRLLAGQNGSGGWSYQCPLPPATELVRLKAVVDQRDKKPPQKGEITKTGSDEDKNHRDPKDKAEPRKLTKEIQAQIDAINRGGGLASLTPKIGMGMGGDNSNTQFAILALWVSRRHGLPVDNALARVDARFRLTQNADGGWSYMPRPEGMPGGGSTPAMTCAGLLGLAAGQGAAMSPVLKAGTSKRDKDKEKDAAGEGPPKKEPQVRDLSKDVHVKAGLKALGKWIGEPIARDQRVFLPPGAGQGDKFYYALWSVERVAVAYSLDTIGNKDWYGWGSDIVISAQQRDGSWRAGYAGGVDTSFALLFLRRANLAGDLSAALKGKVSDPDRVVLKAGPGGDSETKPEPKEEIKPKPEPRDTPPPDRKPVEIKDKPEGTKPTPPATAENEAARMAKELTQANPDKQERALNNLRDGKGADYTQALLKAIPKLDGDLKKKAREALAERMSRMTSATLGDRLRDDDSEMRRASALAVAMKEDTAHIPRLIELLDDSDMHVSRAAYAALKSLSGKDFGPSSKDASRAERAVAVAAWKSWWKEKGGK